MNADTLVDEVIRSDAFKGFGPLLFPVPLGEKERHLTLAQIAPLFPRHCCIDTEETLLALLRDHAALAGSSKARRILDDWTSFRPKFAKVLPAANA